MLDVLTLGVALGGVWSQRVVVGGFPGMLLI